MPAIQPLIAPVLARATFDSGIRVLPKEPDGTPERQTPPPAYADETGETAIRREQADRVAMAIEAMARNVVQARNIARWVLDGVPDTTDEAILRQIPSCEACDLPVFGRVKSGYHADCYAKKQRMGIADRAVFRRVVLAEMAAEQEPNETGATP